MLHDHSQTQYKGYDSSGRVIRPSLRPVPDNTQDSQQTDINASVGFEPTNPAIHFPQTHGLDRTANGIVQVTVCVQQITDTWLDV